MKEDQPIGSGYLSRDVSVISDLVRTLSTRLSNQHESSERLEETAASILEIERQQLQELMAELGRDDSDVKSECGEPENTLSKSVLIARENVELEQQLQRLQFVGGKSQELLKQYMRAMEEIVGDSQIYASDMDHAAGQIRKSYREHEYQAEMRKQELLEESAELKRKLQEVEKQVRKAQIGFQEDE
ncbi:hypothetical protein CJU89_2210 [Yarrowia sp. B02]|nr:hypothetical protein CJU89_2210 [Yarrowia sp. B02]